MDLPPAPAASEAPSPAPLLPLPSATAPESTVPEPPLSNDVVPFDANSGTHRSSVVAEAASAAKKPRSRERRRSRPRPKRVAISVPDGLIPSSPSELGGSFLYACNSAKFKQLEINQGNALFCLSPVNPIRKFCNQVITHRFFDYFILVCILVSSILLAFEDPEAPQERLKILNNIQWGFTAIFLLEMCLKITALGLFAIKGSYLRDPWNIMDAAIVLIPVISAILNSNIGFFKALRTVRALRPLRVIARSEGLRLVVQTLILAVPGIFTAAGLTFLLFLMYAILGVTLLKGKMYKCNNPICDVPRKIPLDECSTPEKCDKGGGRWVLHPRNFNNCGSALLTLFEVATLEQWAHEIMYPAIDAVSSTESPVRDYNPAMALFFVVVIISGSFFMLNIFVGVVLYTFNEVKMNREGLLLTKKQKLWIEAQRLILKFRPQSRLCTRESKLQRLLEPLVTSRVRAMLSTLFRYFDWFITTTIIANIVVMAMEFYNMNPGYAMVCNVLQNVFSGIFLIECVLKLLCYRLRYFWDRWNNFDFFLVLLSIGGLLLEILAHGQFPVNAAFLRTFRILRVLRILRVVRFAKDIQILLETLFYSLPSLANITSLMFLMFFVFAILGMHMFGHVKEGECLNEHANFRRFPPALLLLVRMATGENWNCIMHDCSVRPPHDCTIYEDGRSDCGEVWAPAFFVIFVLFISFVMLNLVIAIILDSFSTTIQIEKSLVHFSDLQRFMSLWQHYDPERKLLINTHELPRLLKELGPPLGLSENCGRVELFYILEEYQIPEHGGQVHFMEILLPLARKKGKVKFSDEAIRQQEVMWREVLPELGTLPALRYRHRRITADQYFAASYIAAAYRRREAMRELKRLKQEKGERAQET